MSCVYFKRSHTIANINMSSLMRTKYSSLTNISKEWLGNISTSLSVKGYMEISRGTMLKRVQCLSQT